MVALADLWLPVVLSAVFVFIASSVIHMLLQMHKRDFSQLPGEVVVLETLRAQGVAPGHYTFPRAATMKEMSSPEMVAKMERGPLGLMTVLPSGVPSIARSLAQWFVFSLVISLFVAYVAGLALEPGAETERVLRIAGTAAILGYAFAHFQEAIWKGLSWRIAFQFFLDGVVYGLVTGATFAWLWPEVG